MIIQPPQLHWKEKSDGFGLGFVQDVPVFNGKELKKVNHPSMNSIVYKHNRDDDTLHPVLVIKEIDQYWFWHELNDDLSVRGGIETGYGDFYESPFKFDVYVSYKVVQKGADNA